MKRIVVIIFLAFGFLITEAQVSKEFISPGAGYTNTLVVTNGKVKTIYISGQVGEGKDLEAQIRSSFMNLKQQLTDAGATFADVVKMTTYIVRYKESDLDIFRGVRKEILGEKNMPANTLVGVYSLFKDEYLVEMEAIAVVETK
ncbi:MAG TPA: RidA family protein [Cyclobacteriaceae bacterium]